MREFVVLGDSVVENLRRFVVRLSLADPDESTLAAYYVFGKEPIWVYRAEDFDMMMNMDMMPDEPARPVVESKSEDTLKAKAGRLDEGGASGRRLDRR